ncbi:GlsB/YeaQ/YmgE family stress response membrane protein [Streptomyces polyrhachis]|uniref:GlsB/YeaQ/YmgE family stress response membrane protein n=1 Tax=Streptomyces polyrhachis TaxID=1282885 RepID=A0ABW2GFB9_9ACTN
MGIIAWIVLGLLAGMIAKLLIPGRDGHGLLITTVIGIAGSLLGGFLAAEVFDIDGNQGFFDVTTWVTAIIGAGILLFAFSMFAGRGGGNGGRGRGSGRSSGRRFSRR